MLDTLVRHLDMVRLSVGVAAIVALSACHGLISGPDNQGGDTTPEGQAAITAWENDAYPVFANNCAACHGLANNSVYPGFLVGATELDMRTTLLNFNPQVVDLNDPAGSQVLTKGTHEGPALSAADSESILTWINAEVTSQQVSDPTPIIETAQFVPELCTSTTGMPGTPDCPINYVKLDSLGLPGAQIEFVAQALSTDLYITDLYAIASTDGLYIEHPLFTTWPSGGQPLPDLLDRFYDVKLNLATSAVPVTCPPIGPSCDHIGAGASVFHDFSPTDPITISFKVLQGYMADSTPPPMQTGCDTAGLQSFVTNVAPLMNAANSCASCHQGQNSGATSAMPLLNSSGAPADLTSTTDNTACLAVRQHVNFQSIPQSPLLLAPDPAGDSNHPLKLPGATGISLTSFQTGVTTWINVEASGQ